MMMIKCGITRQEIQVSVTKDMQLTKTQCTIDCDELNFGLVWDTIRCNEREGQRETRLPPYLTEDINKLSLAFVTPLSTKNDVDSILCRTTFGARNSLDAGGGR